MSIYLSGIRDQLRYTITTTGSVGKAWFNRIVTLIQPAQTFIRYNLRQTGILAASNLAMWVISEKIVSRIDILLPHQAGRDSFKKNLASRAIQVLVTGGLTTGLNVALNRALQLKFDSYILAVITTVSVVSSILWQEFKGRPKQQLLPPVENPVSRTNVNADTVYMTTGDSPTSYSRSTPRMQPTPREMPRRLSTSGNGEKTVRIKPDIPLLNFEGINEVEAEIKSSKAQSRRPLTGGREATPHPKDATSTLEVKTQESVEEGTSSLPVSEVIHPTPALSKEITPREQIPQKLSPKAEHSITAEQSVEAPPLSTQPKEDNFHISPPTTPKASHQSPSIIREETQAAVENDSDSGIACLFSSMHETLDINEPVNPQVASQQATPRGTTPREANSLVSSSNQTTPREDEFHYSSDEDEDDQILKLGTSIDSTTHYMGTETGSNFTTDFDSDDEVSALEEIFVSSNVVSATALPVEPVAVSPVKPVAAPVEPVGVPYVQPVKKSHSNLERSGLRFEDFDNWTY
ncbi:hypothetical protein PNK_0986 [Candidatus Protochlamydia naegleriophila]|uniref:Uncharacterized protein n=1 Tax=Candidatus Protochlamydia naegleriophila TaxID=389348 RepID=A0A0U5ER62_9BACT|nr:hypothetical protein [Candidatus Protochlamydia naegleriophila]CUI16609.1 hypothetical protein PNK_0986 [Candidatus Protochlamydia naegleriophila]